MEREEYNMNTNPYPCSGKKYNGEKAIISMTSWSARIATCPKTIFSLLKQCPGFHIVLVLSEEEFPLMEKELPKALMLFVNNNLIEILWVYKNYKAFKKILFTMDKYRNIPIISADDDCIYLKNYAKELYNTWINCKKKIVSLSDTFGSGYGIIFPPYCYNIFGFKNLYNSIIETNHDDMYYFILAKKMVIPIKCLYKINKMNEFVEFHDSIDSITEAGTAKNEINRNFFLKTIKV